MMPTIKDVAEKAGVGIATVISQMISCVLVNRFTGMTGYQDNPGTGYTQQGDPTALLSVEKILTALGFAPVLTVDPQDLKAMKAAEAKEAAKEAKEAKEAAREAAKEAETPKE